MDEFCFTFNWNAAWQDWTLIQHPWPSFGPLGVFHQEASHIEFRISSRKGKWPISLGQTDKSVVWVQHPRPEIDIETNRFLRCWPDVAWRNLISKTVWGRGTFGHNFIPTAQLGHTQLPKICVQRDNLESSISQWFPLELHTYIYIYVYIYIHIYIYTQTHQRASLTSVASSLSCAIYLPYSGRELLDPLRPGLLRPIYLELPRAGRGKLPFLASNSTQWHPWLHLTGSSAGLLHWRWTIQRGRVHIFIVLAISCFEIQRRIASWGDDGGVRGNDNESPEAWGEAKSGRYKIWEYLSWFKRDSGSFCCKRFTANSLRLQFLL